MSVAELDTLYAAAVAAIDAGNYTLAIQKLMAIKVRLATTPNITRSLSGGGSQQLSWNANQIDTLIGQCQTMQATAAATASGPFQQTKVIYARASSTEE
jgi:hypothetical protein